VRGGICFPKNGDKHAFLPVRFEFRENNGKLNSVFELESVASARFKALEILGWVFLAAFQDGLKRSECGTALKRREILQKVKNTAYDVSAFAEAFPLHNRVLVQRGELYNHNDRPKFRE
jgi:hypothetical protein